MIERIVNKIKREWRKATTVPRDQQPKFPDYWFRKIYAGKSAQVVQIGSNDGKTGDPLHELLLKNQEWKALFVEPIPSIFERLQTNYPPESRFQFANVAINDGSQMPFYYVTSEAKVAHPELPYWYDQLGSFNRNHLTQHLDGKLAPFIRSLEVKGKTLAATLEQWNIEQIDILHIDCEGYDWKVLSQLDLVRYQPGLILFEYHHLEAEELAAARAFLSADYEIKQLGIDYLAIRKNLNDLR